MAIHRRSLAPIVDMEVPRTTSHYTVDQLQAVDVLKSKLDAEIAYERAVYHERIQELERRYMAAIADVLAGTPPPKRKSA